MKSPLRIDGDFPQEDARYYSIFRQVLTSDWQHLPCSNSLWDARERHKTNEDCVLLKRLGRTYTSSTIDSKAFSRVMTRSAGRVRRCFKNPRIESGQEVFNILRVGPGHLTLTRLDPREVTRLVKSPDYNTGPTCFRTTALETVCATFLQREKGKYFIGFWIFLCMLILIA